MNTVVYYFTANALAVHTVLSNSNPDHPGMDDKNNVQFLYLYMYVCVYVCVYVCIYVCMYVCMYFCLFACVVGKIGPIFPYKTLEGGEGLDEKWGWGPGREMGVGAWTRSGGEGGRAGV